jgi:vancomycin permeability regulator SanA
MIPSTQRIFIVFIIVFTLTAGYLCFDGLQDKKVKSDVAIILGSKVNPDGSLSPRLAARVNKGIELYQDGMVKKIIVSSGITKEGIDEALAMKQYLLAHRIPSTDIIMDNQGYNTHATAKNSYQIMKAHGMKQAILVSQYFHITRSRLAFKQCDISPVSTAHANFFEWRDFYSIAREVFGYYYYLVAYRNCD